MDPRELKDKASQLFSKGKFAKAAESYEEFCTLDPKDHLARMRAGDAWLKAGKKDKAVGAYTVAAQGYAKDGFLPRAIAASKRVLEVDPSQTHVQTMLATLYAQKNGPRKVENAEAPPLKPVERAEFTELEFDPDSLLQSIEAEAAGSGIEVELDDELHVDVVDASGLLPKVPLFSDLSEEAFIALFERCPLQFFDPGQRIVGQGDKADAFFVICAGQVKVFRQDENGARKALATLDEGNFFGEMALLSDSPRGASVEAVVETQVLVISAPILRELAEQYPTLVGALRKFCRQRLLMNLMNHAALFSSFNRDDRRELVQKFRAREAAKGEVLLKEGELSDGLYVVLSGEVEVVSQGNRVATLKESQIFGERSLLMRSPAAASVIAARRTSLLRLPKQDFDVLILSHPQVLEHVSTLVDERNSMKLPADDETDFGGLLAELV